MAWRYTGLVTLLTMITVVVLTSCSSEPTPLPAPTQLPADSPYWRLHERYRSPEVNKVADEFNVKYVEMSEDSIRMVYEPEVLTSGTLVADACCDLVDMAESLFKLNGDLSSVVLVARAGFIDLYGNTNVEEAVRMELIRSTFGKMNPEGIKSRFRRDWRDCELVMDEFELYPGLRRQLGE